MTLEERKTTAMAARKEGYNCAQSVMLAFADKTDIDTDTLKKLGAGLGSGVGGQGEICGVVLGMSLIEGLQHGSEAMEKAIASKSVRELSVAFKEHNGCLLCRELKGNGKPCDELILDGVEILHNRFEAK